jgi:LacI family transcriptional regulator
VKSSGHTITVHEELGAPSSPEFGREAVRRLLSLKDRPTALVIGAVQNTSGVIDEIQDQALRVPRDISVIGFGDELGYRWWGPGLTTVQLPVSELATACGLWFLHHLQNKGDLSKPYSFISPPQLVIRGSTSAP